MDTLSMVEAKGSYQFKINHLKTKDMGTGEWITSPTFRVGPHDWVILYYPQGKKSCSGKSASSVFLKVQRESVDVKATFGFALLDKTGTVSSSSLRVISQTFASRQNALGVPAFVERTTLEDTYVKDGYFVLHVSITVKDESCEGVSHTGSTVFACERIRKFREENKQTDVIFDVKGKKFVAHRLILAAHSPVFEAEFFGSMAESKMKCIPIKEMVPSVFGAMLDFMYNGSLPITEKLINGDESKLSVSFFQKHINGDEPMSYVSFFQNLLAAADRYAVESLKALCEYKLVERISMDTVVSLLESAERHNCKQLKKKCFLFVVAKNNSVPLMFNEEYITLMHNYPSLLAELQEMAK